MNKELKAISLQYPKIFNGLLKENDFKELRDICEDCEFKWDVKIV